MPVYKLKPACKDYIWGGTRLREEFGIDDPGERVAEAWVLSCHQDGPSVIASGKYAGETLMDYINLHGKRVLGSNCEKFDEFPILTKLIDAKRDLSIQVHPNNTFAMPRRLETIFEHGRLRYPQCSIRRKNARWYGLQTKDERE